jgi:hypothetical protein
VISRRMAAFDDVIAIARNPGQYAAFHETLAKDDLLVATISQPHFDDLFRYTEAGIDSRDSGSDPVVMLRSPLFAKYHNDPRYLRLLNKAGFDDAGVPR